MSAPHTKTCHRSQYAAPSAGVAPDDIAAPAREAGARWRRALFQRVGVGAAERARRRRRPGLARVVSEEEQDDDCDREGNK
uniref:Uncharacterized protein n=1 Tax=Arundo donax TaxID=35708 RepID=A0A0A9DDM6_ARUDO